ncbi:MAG: hypothetical protein ACHQ4H_10250, partial [Ktedonobacterales bacterium]
MGRQQQGGSRQHQKPRQLPRATEATTRYDTLDDATQRQTPPTAMPAPSPSPSASYDGPFGSPRDGSFGAASSQRTRTPARGRAPRAPSAGGDLSNPAASRPPRETHETYDGATVAASRVADLLRAGDAPAWPAGPRDTGATRVRLTNAPPA